MSVVLSEVHGKSEGKIFQAKYRPLGILFKCLRKDLF